MQTNFFKSLSILLLLLNTSVLANENKIPQTRKNQNNFEFDNENTESNYFTVFEKLHEKIYHKNLNNIEYLNLKNNIKNLLKMNNNKVSKKQKINLIFHLYLLNKKFLYLLKPKNKKEAKKILEENLKIKQILKNIKCEDKNLIKIINKI